MIVLEEFIVEGEKCDTNCKIPLKNKKNRILIATAETKVYVNKELTNVQADFSPSCSFSLIKKGKKIVVCKEVNTVDNKPVNDNIK
jgi:hypothetical protein